MILEELDGYKHKNDKMYWDKYILIYLIKKKINQKQDKIKQMKEKEVENYY